MSEAELADAAQLSSLADETPEGRSIVVLAKEKYGLRGREIAAHEARVHSLHRADAHERSELRRPRRSARARRNPIKQHIIDLGGTFPQSVSDISDAISRTGGTPLVVRTTPACSA